MANKTDDNRRRIIALVQEKGLRQIGESEWTLLRETLPGIAESSLRTILLHANLPIEQPWRGVDQHTLDELEETLATMAEYYARQPAAARAMVIAAKDKARFAARNQKVTAQKRALKLEMVEWMLVWLGDPAMFPTWARLRKRQL